MLLFNHRFWFYLFSQKIDFEFKADNLTIRKLQSRRDCYVKGNTNLTFGKIKELQ